MKVEDYMASVTELDLAPVSPPHGGAQRRIAIRVRYRPDEHPSTAINCVDQLTRILMRWVGRAPPATLLSYPPHVVRVIIPWIDFDHLLDTVFEQIRHYAVSDIAVSLRLLRALDDLAATTDDEWMRERLVLRGRRIVAGCATRVDASDFKRLESRLAELEARAPASTLNALDGAQAK